MKARIPNSAKLTKKQLQAAESYSRQVVKTDQERLLRRYFKLMCYVLNRNFGFGSKRCLAVINGISRLSAEHDQDEIFWEHLDRVVVDEMKLDFEKSPPVSNIKERFLVRNIIF